MTLATNKMDRRGLSITACHKRRQVDVVLAIEGAVNCVDYFSESVQGRHIYKVIRMFDFCEFVALHESRNVYD